MTRDEFFRYAPLIALVIFLGLKFFTSRPDANAGQVRTLLQQGATLVDVRSPGEFASGHIDGAINIPVDQIRARMSEIPGGKPVVLYCRSGARSSSAAQTLRGAGRTDVHNAGAMSNLQ
jgi:phage shock protein E